VMADEELETFVGSAESASDVEEIPASGES
jgi:hypothetical protein